MSEIVVKEKKEQLPDIKLDIADIKKYIAPDATDKELFMFVNIAKSYGLNPFKREVHFIKYDKNKPGQTVVGYEVYLKRAEATQKLDGWKCWIDGDTAVIEIKRKDWSEPFRWVVSKKEFDKGQSTWNQMPQFMLKKVAIAQGFRLAFPEDLGGMPYIPEEISNSTSESLTQPLPNYEETSKKETRLSKVKEIIALYKKKDITGKEQILEAVKKAIGREIISLKDDATDEELNKIMESLKKPHEDCSENPMNCQFSSFDADKTAWCTVNEKRCLFPAIEEKTVKENY